MLVYLLSLAMVKLTTLGELPRKVPLSNGLVLAVRKPAARRILPWEEARTLYMSRLKVRCAHWVKNILRRALT